MNFKKVFDFSFQNFRGDLFGGITAGIVALPLALAFGQQTDLGAAAGLFGAIFIAFFASLFGGTSTQISGPTAPMTAVSYIVISQMLQENNGSLEQALPSILLVFLAAGILQIILGVLKIGKYIKYIPYPVVSGFMSGIGFIIILTQLFPVLGYQVEEDKNLVQNFIPQAEQRIIEKILDDESKGDVKVLKDYQLTIDKAEKISPLDKEKEAKSLAKKATGTASGMVKYLPNAIQNMNYLHFGMVLLTIFIIYGFNRVTTKVPSTLVALLFVSIVVYFAGWGGSRLLLIDKIPQGFPDFHLFNIITHFKLNVLGSHVIDIFSLAILGAIDSLLTSVVADNMTKTKHDSNQELIGQGVGNSMASLFGGLPGAGATIRTVVNINSGGKTKLSGMVAGLLLLLVLLALGPLASMIPQAVLAGILITVGIGVMDYKGLKSINKIPKHDAFVMILVLVITVFIGLIQAVALGMIISALVFMKKMGDINAKKSGIKSVSDLDEEEETKVVDNNDRHEFIEHIPQKLRNEVYIKEFGDALFFGVIDEVKANLSRIPEHATCVVLLMDKVDYMDQSGVFALEDVFLEIKRKNIQILLVNLQEQPRYLMDRIEIIPNLVEKDHIFNDYISCADWIQENIRDIE